MWKLVCILSIIWAVGNTAPVENNNDKLQVLEELADKIKELVQAVKLHSECMPTDPVVAMEPEEEIIDSEENISRKIVATSSASGGGTADAAGYLADRLQALAERNREKWAAVADAYSTSTTQRPPLNPCDEIPNQMALFRRNLNAIVSRAKTRMDTAKGNNGDVKKAHDDGIRDINIETVRSSTSTAELFGISVAEIMQVLNGVYTPATQCIGSTGPEANMLIRSLITDLDSYAAKNLV